MMQSWKKSIKIVTRGTRIKLPITTLVTAQKRRHCPSDGKVEAQGGAHIDAGHGAGACASLEPPLDCCPAVALVVLCYHRIHHRLLLTLAH